VTGNKDWRIAPDCASLKTLCDRKQRLAYRARLCFLEDFEKQGMFELVIQRKRDLMLEKWPDLLPYRGAFPKACPLGSAEWANMRELCP